MGVGNKINTTGYSGTPLAKKLGIKPSFRIKLVNAPAYYFDLFTDLPGDLRFEDDIIANKDMIHFFMKQKEEYIAVLPELKSQVTSNGIIWVSWSKKSSGVLSNVSENLIRDYAIKRGLVDIKVCAVNEIWSGLKLVIPVKDRRICEIEFVNP